MLLAECEAAGVDVRRRIASLASRRRDRFTVNTDHGAFTGRRWCWRRRGQSDPQMGATGPDGRSSCASRGRLMRTWAPPEVRSTRYLS